MDRARWRAERRPGAQPAVLHPRRRSRRTCGRCTKTGGREADDFYRDRWSHDKVVRSTHGVNCTGSCSWKVYVKDGIITWETQQTDYPSVGPGHARSTSRAAARAARRSPGTPTHRPGCATPTSAACCCRCSARPRPSTTATRSWPGRDIVDEPAAGQGVQVGPRQGRPGPRHLGRGDRDRRRRPRPHDQEVRPRPGRRLLADPGDVDGLARRRAPGSCNLIGGSMLQLLRLVRRPAGRLPAGLRRPDRRPGVGGLVERRLPDHVGLQPAGHPHAGRALDDRGPLPRPEGRSRSPRTTPTT